MSGPFDINGLGANYFNSVQSGLVLGNASALYSPAFTSSATNISASLTQLCNLDVPSGKTRVLLMATLSALDSGSALVDVEVEIDGVTVLTAATTLSGATAYLIGTASLAASSTVVALQANRNIKIRAKKPSSTAAVLTLWFIDRA